VHLKHFDIAVVGGGIVGVAHALASAKAGRSVVLFERSIPAVGASVRNFGLVWPVGQPAGPRHERALRSREIWKEVAASANLYLADTGSLHLAYREDEWALLEEFSETPSGSAHGRGLITPAEALGRCRAVNPSGLLGALWSPTECTVDPRQAIRALPGWLASAHGVEVVHGATVKAVNLPLIETSAGSWKAEQALVCSGPDFETLYPEVFAAAEITRCKLQMMRTAPQPSGWQLGPALCAGLTLAHYDAFKACTRLADLEARFRSEYPFHTAHGIHVLLSQTSTGELTIGDSHHYGLTVNPFDREDIDRAILDYLGTFATAPSLALAERWHGVYPRMTNGESGFVISPAPGVRIVNGLGGAGMTLSFGLAEEVVASL
jgi:FAD dependent oxidoreductase TIGR03364